MDFKLIDGTQFNQFNISDSESTHENGSKANSKSEPTIECVFETMVTADKADDKCEIEHDKTIQMNKSNCKVVFKTKSVEDYHGQLDINACPSKGLYILATL